jgi:hypothetical protein
MADLFFLGTTTSGLLRSLEGLLVLSGCSRSLEAAHEPSSSLERTLQVSDSWLAEQVDLDLVAFECTLEGDDRLDQERVRVLEVQVHDSHHSHAHYLCLVESLHLLDIVFVVGGCDELGLLGAAHLRLLDVLQGCHVCSRAVRSVLYETSGDPRCLPFFLLIRKCT